MEEMAGYYPPPPPPPPPSAHQNSHYPSYYAPPPPPPPQPTLGAPPSMAQPHLSHWYTQPQQPPFSSYAHGFPPHGDDVRTLFIAGLPEDVKAREIYNLFREFPGYQSSQLRTASKGSQPFGFAVFADQYSAVAALQALNGLVFDLEKNSTLYIDLAKSNSRSKRSRADDGRSGFSEKKARGLPDSGAGSNFHMPGMGNSAYDMVGYSSTQSHGYDDGTSNATDAKRLNSAGPYAPQSSAPCPTLFVANLGPTCSEQELNQLFSRCPGFLKLKMQNKNGAPVAFVDFQDTACSTAALNSLQDRVLYSSVGEGMRLEYAKSRMGQRKKS